MRVYLYVFKYLITFRYESTGIRPEYLRDAMPLRHVQRKIQDFLCNGEPIWKIRPRGGKARILVGHGLGHDMECLELNYPFVKIRYVYLHLIYDLRYICYKALKSLL